MDDIELIERSLDGDMDAFGLIVRKYQSSLLSLSWNILRDMEEAKDSVQETFLQVLQNLYQFDQKRNFKNWLYSIAYKRAIDRKRRISFLIRKIGELGRNRQELLKENHQVSNDYFMDEKGNGRELLKENHQEVWDLLQRLNQKERTAILLQSLEGLSAKEIGEVLGCAENTVRVHLFNARKKLKKLLK